MSIHRQWQTKETETKDFSSLPLPHLIKKILSSRGFETDESVREFLAASLKQMKNPYILKDMDVAVTRLFEAFQKQESILVYGDFDLDGSSGLTILVDGLRDFGFQNVSYFQPKRLKDGYGLHAKFIEEFKKNKIDLILTVDLGITAIEAAQECKRLAVDLVITDHHLPQEELPEALAIVNPNRKDCTSGLKYLCGAGVGYYLLIALKMKWADKKIPHQWDPKSPLDLLLIAILTDMVPLKFENRALAKHGLTHFQNTKRPALQYLLKNLNMVDRPLSGQDVAIGFAPKLNALSRLEEDVLPIDLFLEKDPNKAGALTMKALKMNEERKNLQTDAEVEATALHHINKDQGFVFVHSQNFHKGVIGLVATKLTQALQVPSFVASEFDGRLLGSARAPDNYAFSLLEIFQQASEYLDGFGGHRAAAGFQLSLEKAEGFRKVLTEILKHPPAVTNSLYYDTEAKLQELNEELLDALDVLGPFGTDFPTPIFLVKNIVVTSKTEMRGGHLRLQIQDKNGNRKTALLFSPPIYAKEISEKQEVDLLVELQWNYYNGRKSTQVLIKDIQARI